MGKLQVAETNKKWESGVNVQLKEEFFFNSSGSDIDKLFFDWFAKARCLNIPISGPILKATAKEIAVQLRLFDSSASNGWLQKWRRTQYCF